MNVVESFVNELRLKNPNLKIAFKDEVWWMRVLGKLLFFNSTFMTSFATTIRNTIYLPSRQWYKDRIEKDPISLLALMAHEYTHIQDGARLNFLIFSLLYSFPLSLIPFLMLGLFFLKWYVILPLCIICLLPVPAVGRKYIEWRGYQMSLFVRLVLDPNQDKEKLAAKIDHHFTGWNYYLMWIFGVREQINKTIKLIESNQLQKTDVIYQDVTQALLKAGALSR